MINHRIFNNIGVLSLLVNMQKVNIIIIIREIKISKIIILTTL